MTELFLSLALLSFKASFLILAVVILRLLLKKAPRRMICALWLLVGLRLLVPFSIESSLSLVPSEPDFEREPPITESGQLTAPAVTPTVETAPYAPLTQPNTQGAAPIQPPAIETEAAEPAAWETVAAAVWLAGLGLMLGYLAISCILLHRSLREAVPVGDGVWKCGAVSSPFVLGLFRPRVYISYGMSPEQTKYVLAHERSHIVRRDHWTKFIGFLILSLHWFNPLVWLAYALLCRDIELACDEKVIRGMDAEGRKAYSFALLQCAVKASPLAACPLAFGELGVKQRIKSVLSYKKPTVWIILAAIICGIAVGVLFLTDKKAESKSPPPDCPDEVWETISAFMDARCVSAEAAKGYFYTGEDTQYGNEVILLSYEVEYVKEYNPLLYSFKWSGKRGYSESDALYYRKTGQRRNTSSGIFYVFNIDGEWKLASMQGYIPAHILRGEAAETETPQNYDCPDEVMNTYLRWIKAMSDGSGDFEVYKELTYLGEGVEPINPGISIADIVSDEIQSVTRVNDCLYEFISVYSLKYSEGEFGAQRFVGYVDGKWMLMLYDVVPTALQEGLENCDRWTWDNEGNQVIIPAHSYTDPELPVEAHLMDKLKFYLPAIHSCGVYDIYLGYAGGGVPIYYADGTLCGQMELNYAMEVRIDKGEIIFIDDGMNHASFISDLESIDHSVPCAVAEFSDDGGSYWYVIFAKEDSAFCYALKLHTGYFSRDEAIRMAKAVRFTTEAFNSFDEIERLYWPIIDSYAAALSRGLLPSEMTDAGLNWAVVDHCEDPLNEAGWTIEDIDGNDTPELLIGKQSFETGRGTPIYSLYTLDGEYIPVEVFSGFTRSMYYFIKDNYFHHHGSAGVGNDSESYFEYSNGRLTELEAAPDTKVYGIYIRNFSSIMGYSSDYGVHLTSPDPDDPAEYALSNGLELGMGYAEVVSIMGKPESIEALHGEEFVGMSMYCLNYPGEATLYLMADYRAPVEDGTLRFAQIYSDTISFGRIKSSDRSLEYISSLYGMEPVPIEPGSTRLPLLQNLSIPTDGYFDSGLSLVPQDEAIWEDGPPTCALLLFRDGALECIYLRYAVAIDFQPTVGAPE